MSTNPQESTRSILEAAFQQAQKAEVPAEEPARPEPEAEAKETQPEAEVPESTEAKSESEKKDDPIEYSAEDLDKLGKELGPKAAEELDEAKLKDQALVEKKRAMDRIFDAKMKEFNSQLDEARKYRDELQAGLDAVNKQREKYKEIVGEDAEEDPKIKELSERQSVQEREINWMQAERTVKEIFPDYGLYDDAEMKATLTENPELMELAKVGNGRFGTLVLAATHYLTQRKPENWSKIIGNELDSNYEAHRGVLDKAISRRIAELKEREHKKNNVTKVAKKTEAVVTPSVTTKKGSGGSFGDILKGEMLDLLANPEKLPQK